MSNKNIRRVVIFGAFAIFIVLFIQGFVVWRTWNMNERDFDRSVTIALQNTAKDLAALHRQMLPQNMIQRLTSNYYVVNTNAPIDASNLDFYLRKELEAISLNEDFEYGIYDCHDDRMVYGNYITYSPDRDTTNMRRDLPKFDNFLYYFGVRFPRRTAYLVGEMSLTIVLTAILLVTVLFFMYALFVIMQQKRFSELQKDFINNMTHEFKTPISTIKISADVFASHPLILSDERLSRYARIIREQNVRLNLQVEKVLQLNKIDKKTLELSLEPVDLHEILETVIPSIQVKIEQQKGKLTLHLDATETYIKADTLHLTNIIHNLLDNAMKYCKGAPDITISTKDIGKNGLLFRIADKGIGIDREHQSKVFDRFFRVPTGDVHNVKGFGLGLFYVKSIVNEHHWRINLSSKLGEGTTIDIIMTKESDE